LPEPSVLPVPVIPSTFVHTVGRDVAEV
jgi:hypothetical protein